MVALQPSSAEGCHDERKTTKEPSRRMAFGGTISPAFNENGSERRGTRTYHRFDPNNHV